MKYKDGTSPPYRDKFKNISMKNFSGISFIKKLDELTNMIKVLDNEFLRNYQLCNINKSQLDK